MRLNQRLFQKLIESRSELASTVHELIVPVFLGHVVILVIFGYRPTDNVFDRIWITLSCLSVALLLFLAGAVAFIHRASIEVILMHGRIGRYRDQRNWLSNMPYMIYAIAMVYIVIRLWISSPAK